MRRYTKTVLRSQPEPAVCTVRVEVAKLPTLETSAAIQGRMTGQEWERTKRCQREWKEAEWQKLRDFETERREETERRRERDRERKG